MYTFKKMERLYAEQICHWTYPEPFSLYSMDGSEECVREFLEENYYAGLDQQGQLVGYICYGSAARVPGGYSSGIYDALEHGSFIDIGLGLKPDLTGKGLGLDFFQAGLAFLQKTTQVSHFRLVVATFNRRAISVYQRAGFVLGQTFYSKVGDQEIEFVSMTSPAITC